MEVVAHVRAQQPGARLLGRRGLADAGLRSRQIETAAEVGRPEPEGDP